MSDAAAGVRVMWMRGGTSKGGFFLARDLPADPAARDRLLMGAMGSPDPRQIDGMGGADPLTSKVAVVGASERPGVDVDFLFLQVGVAAASVTDAQNCGNILAGVGPFAIERGLVPAQDGETPVTIFMENTGRIAVARVATPGRRVRYDGSARIDGVPGTAAPVPIEFRETAGATCGALFPSGAVMDRIEGVEATLIDNGMPCVVLRSDDMGITGQETPEELEYNTPLRDRLERLRRLAGPMMRLGDVTHKTVPKMTMVSPAGQGGAVSTRTFIPHRCHTAIGVLGAVSVATACLTEGAVGADLADVPGGTPKAMAIEHPSGALTVLATVEGGTVVHAEVLRTARKLMDGVVYPAEPVPMGAG